MASLKYWLEKAIAFTLNDDEPNHEFTRYPIPNVLMALNDAMSMIFKFRPDLFTDYHIIKLTPGRHQDVRGCFDNVLDIIEQTDASGNIIKSLDSARRTISRAKTRWTKPSCIVPKDAPDGYVIEYTLTDVNMNGQFDVYPPVPCDTDVYVRAKCVKRPCKLTTDDLDKTFNPGDDIVVAAKHFTLAWLLTGDRFVNAGVRDMSNQHIQLAYQVLGVQLKAEDRMESKEKAGDFA